MFISTSLTEEDGVYHATHSCYFASEAIVDRGGDAEDDASGCGVAERILVCDNHRENNIEQLLRIRKLKFRNY